MNRRTFLAQLGVGGVAALSGCLRLEGLDGGVLTVMPLTSPPDATVVSATDERLSDASLIQRALDHVVQRDPHETVDFRLNSDEYETTAETLEQLPYYDRIETGASFPSGYYVSHGAFVYRIICKPLCSDLPFVSAKNRRNSCWTDAPKDTTTLPEA
ncbi:hypothetical protein [Haloferax larsenii]|nr:hypothetical protein [Haloferax larsenii]